MRAKELKDILERLADSDPDGFGALRTQLGAEEWQRVANHATGFIGAWVMDKIDEAVKPERDMADALAYYVEPKDGYRRDVMRRHEQMKEKRTR